jgi:hypothetical protein
MFIAFRNDALHIISPTITVFYCYHDVIANRCLIYLDIAAISTKRCLVCQWLLKIKQMCHKNVENILAKVIDLTWYPLPADCICLNFYDKSHVFNKNKSTYDEVITKCSYLYSSQPQQNVIKINFKNTFFPYPTASLPDSELLEGP